MRRRREEEGGGKREGGRVSENQYLAYFRIVSSSCWLCLEFFSIGFFLVHSCRSLNEVKTLRNITTTNYTSTKLTIYHIIRIIASSQKSTF